MAASKWALVCLAATLGSARAEAGIFVPTQRGYRLATDNASPIGVATDPDGNIWFTENFADKLGLLEVDDPDPMIAEIPEVFGPSAITQGPDGNMWFIEDRARGIARLNPDNTISRFPIPTILNAPIDITSGPDNRLWFTERTFDRGLPSTGFIGNISLSGTINEMRIDAPAYSITRGPDNALWFTGNGLGRMTTNGQYRVFPTEGLPTNDVTTGPDGALWFTYYRSIDIPEDGAAGGPILEEPPAIGRMTTDGVVTSFIPPDPLIRPIAITRGPEDNLWFTTENGSVWRINLAGTMVQASFSFAEDNPALDIAAGGDGRLYFTLPTENEIASVDSLSFLPINLSNGTPLGLARGPEDSIWFADYGGHRIGRIDTNGSVRQFEIGEDQYPNAVAVGLDGSAWFTNPSEDTIGRITADGEVAAPIIVPDGPSTPLDIVRGPDGNFWFTEYDAGAIGRITPQGVIRRFEIPNPNVNGAGPRIAAGFPSPVNITVGPDGNLWFTDEGLNAIGRMSTAGDDIVTFPIPTADSLPAGIAAGGDGNLYFVESNSGLVGRVTTAGVITELGEPDDESYPQAITLGPDGAMWFTESDVNRIGRIGRDGRITKFVLPIEDSGPTGIIGRPDGRLYVSLLNASQILYTDLAAAEPTRTATSIRPPTPTRTVPPNSTVTSTPTVTLTVPPGSTATATPEPTSTMVFTADCFGDCNGDTAVTISELISAVNIALGNADYDSCHNADADRDGEIRINDLIACVNRAQQGCSP